MLMAARKENIRIISKHWDVCESLYMSHRNSPLKWMSFLFAQSYDNECDVSADNHVLPAHQYLPLLQATTCMWIPCTPSTFRKWPSWPHPWLRCPCPAACPSTTTETRRRETSFQFSPETSWATMRRSGGQRCMLPLAGLWSVLTSKPHTPLRSVLELACTVIVSRSASYDEWIEMYDSTHNLKSLRSAVENGCMGFL